MHYLVDSINWGWIILFCCSSRGCPQTFPWWRGLSGVWNVGVYFLVESYTDCQLCLKQYFITVVAQNVSGQMLNFQDLVFQHLVSVTLNYQDLVSDILNAVKELSSPTRSFHIHVWKGFSKVCCWIFKILLQGFLTCCPDSQITCITLVTKLMVPFWNINKTLRTTLLDCTGRHDKITHSTHDLCS